MSSTRICRSLALGTSTLSHRPFHINRGLTSQLFQEAAPSKNMSRLSHVAAVEMDLGTPFSGAPKETFEIEVGRPLTGEEVERGKFFEYGDNHWEHGCCQCASIDGIMCVLSSLVGLKPCFMAFQGWELYTRLGSSSCCNLLGCCFAPYGVGKMAQALEVHEDVDCCFGMQWTCCLDCQILRFKAEALRVEGMDLDSHGHHRPWNQSLFGCCDDPMLTCCVCACPCIAQGMFYERLGKNCCLYGLCGCCCLDYTRGRIVHAYGINESFNDFAWKRIFCPLCATCQLFAQVKQPQ